QCVQYPDRQRAPISGRASIDRPATGLPSTHLSKGGIECRRQHGRERVTSAVTEIQSRMVARCQTRERERETVSVIICLLTMASHRLLPGCCWFWFLTLCISIWLCIRQLRWMVIIAR